MPNNGIISRYATVPEEFKVNTTTEFDNTTDTIVVNKALNGIKVEQKAITLNQLAGMVGGGSQGPQGVQGPQGPAGPTSPAGLNWIGAWQTGVTYYLNDVVTYVDPSTDIIGSYWVNVESISDNTPPCDASGDVNTPQWAFLASQGPQGIQGPEGPQGIVGPQGPAGVVPDTVLNWVGLHSTSNAYPKGSVVKKSGTGSTAGDYVYYALTAVSSGVSLPTLGTSTSTWQLIGSYGTGVTGISYGFGSFAKGNVSLGVSPTQFTSNYWYVNPVSGGTNAVNLAVFKPYSEFGTIFAFNGPAGIPSGIFLQQNAYVNDYSFTSSQLSITAVSGSPGTYQFNLPPWLDGFNEVNNVIDLNVYGDSSINSDLFMVKFAYDAYNNPDVITFRIFINSSGAWIPWSSGSQTPRFNIYIKKYNN
jgi:hypothetical protein